MPDSRKYLLRIEGVNLTNVIDDTDHLSVRRGGGLMILNAATEFMGSFKDATVHHMKEIATGASIGLFEFKATDGDAAEAVRCVVETHFRDGHLKYLTMTGKKTQLPLRHGTFVVDVVPVSEFALLQQMEQLAVAKNRWRQLQEPTLSLDGMWEMGSEPCALNRIRVANTICDLPEKPNTAVSQTVRDRLDYGRGARQQFYRREIGKAAEQLLFTNDLHELSGMYSADGVPIPADDPMVDKMAVFYVDGNGFGKIGREVFKKKGGDGYRAWSEALRSHHRMLLRGLVSLARIDPSWQNGEAIRLETLLWGGDEILWVMPAWKGWEVAKWFFNQEHKVLEHEVTYGCGLVFCHAKAPIKNITMLAHRLGDLAKSARGDENVHRLAYEVLETYDDISGDLSAHRLRFLPPGHDAKELVIDPGRLDSCWKVLQQVTQSSDFPMRQLYMLTKAWRKQHRADVENHETRVCKACTDAGIEINMFLNAFGNTAAWLHLLQMLPYIPSNTPFLSGVTV
jgi:hypothetical protein